MHGGWLYIMTNKRDGVLYIGVTAYLATRVDHHRSDKGSAFCRKYGLKTLVYAERHDTIEEAIAREKQVKEWKREWKVALIAAINPEWQDLYDTLA